MKITINELAEREAELPLYFRSTDSPEIYFMTVGDNAAVKVTDRVFNNDGLEIYPKIEIVAPYQIEIYVRKGFIPISEAEFKNAYIRTSFRFDKLMN